MDPAVEMARQSRSNKAEKFAKGKVTPVQIAYIVDQYLSENLFTQTRSSFRSEASSLLFKTPLQERPKGLLSLEAIIDEYVSLKEQKMVVELEKRRIEQENFRVQSLLRGMQNVMNAYDASAPALAAAPSGQIAKVPHLTPSSVAPNNLQGPTSFTGTQMVANPTSKKRQASSTTPCAPTNAKKSRSKMLNNQSSEGSSGQFVQQPATMQPSTSGCVANLSPVEASSGSKVTFHQTKSTSATQNSSDPLTPTRTPSAHSDKKHSPVGQSSSTDSSNKSTPPDFTSNCTIVSTKTILLSPYKQAAYYSVEKHCSSGCSPSKGEFQRSIKRGRVKGRLNFDGPDETTSLEKSSVNESSSCNSDDGNFFDLDLSILDFDISELLDFDIQCEQQDAPSSGNCSSQIQGSTSS